MKFILIVLGVLHMVAPISAEATNLELPVQLKSLDIAVDLNEGRTFVSPSKMNPKGMVYVVDSKTEVELETIKTAPQGRVFTKEIEFFKNELFVLSNTPEGSTIKVFAKKPETGNWETLSEYVFNESFFKHPSKLHVEIDGTLTVQGYSAEIKKPAILQFVRKDGSLESVATVPFAALTSGLPSVENIETDEQPSPAPGTKAEFAKSSGAGITAGLLSGLGFAYRKFFGNRLGMNIGFGALSSNGEIQAGLGLELLRVFDEREKVRFLGILGVSSFYSRDKIVDYSNPNGIPVEYFQDEASFNFGAGIGIEWAPGGFKNRGVAFSFELPLTFRTLLTEGQDGLKFVGIAPVPSATLVYNFSN